MDERTRRLLSWVLLVLALIAGAVTLRSFAIGDGDELLALIAAFGLLAGFFFLRRSRP
jgi:uncharacterized membrane protein